MMDPLKTSAHDLSQLTDYIGDKMDPLERAEQILEEVLIDLREAIYRLLELGQPIMEIVSKVQTALFMADEIRPLPEETDLPSELPRDAEGLPDDGRDPDEDETGKE